MSLRYHGPLYLACCDEVSEDQRDPERQDVVEVYEDGRSHIDIAMELWTLAGHDARAEAIVALVDRALGRGFPALLAADVRELLGLLAGLEDALKRERIVDESLQIRPERMAEVRRRAWRIDVREDRGAFASTAVWEGLTRVTALRRMLAEASDRGLDLALD